MDSIDQHLQTGVEHHRAGQLGQAEQCYRAVLATDPRHPQAYFLLGLIALSVGQWQGAAECLSTAIRFDGRQADYHRALGDALQGLGEGSQAIDSYRQAVKLAPHDGAMQHKLGCALFAVGDIAAAVDALETTVRVAPESAEAWHDLGVVLQQRGDFAAAIRAHRTALEHKPRFVEARLGLAQALYLAGAWPAAADEFSAAAADDPQSPRAHAGLGLVLHSLGRFAEAAECHRRAIALEPSLAAAHYNLGTALCALEEYQEALASLTTAVELQPGFVQAHLNRSSALSHLGRADEAVEAARRAIELVPNWSAAHGRLAMALQDQGELAEAIASFRRAVALDPRDANVHSSLLYALNFAPGVPPAEIAAEHRAWAARHADPLTGAAAAWERDRSPDRKLRIGYVSAHFRQHAISFFSEPMIAAHDRDAFELFAYSDVIGGDATTERLRRYFDRWRDLAGQSDELVAQRVRDDQIDILVDLSGHIGGNRLLAFARRPAPVQVTYLGYQNTTGMTAMDYRLTDEHADPADTPDAEYSERRVRLPDLFYCFAPAEPAPDVAPLPALAHGAVTFASWNHVQKLTPAVLSTWAEILARVPGSRLLFLADRGGRLEQNVRNVMARAGVDPGRVEFVAKRPRYEYLELHARADLALDMFPFNGHTTVCDALWMGVPSIMLEGDRYASRFGCTVMRIVGLAECVARSEKEYVEIAVRLASDRERLAEWRRTMRTRMRDSKLLDAAGFTRHLEAAYRQMWHEWCRVG